MFRWHWIAKCATFSNNCMLQRSLLNKQYINHWLIMDCWPEILLYIVNLAKTILQWLIVHSIFHLNLCFIIMYFYFQTKVEWKKDLLVFPTLFFVQYLELLCTYALFWINTLLFILRQSHQNLWENLYLQLQCPSSLLRKCAYNFK